MPTAAQEDERLALSRALAAEFGGELMGELKFALETEGPAAAVSICRDAAPQIAARLSRTSGARITRVSTRFRNPANAPDDWQRESLARFAELMPDPQAFRPPTLPERFEADEQGVARYLKAIPVSGMCLTCHGEHLADPVVQALEESYPYDRATGYQLGDLRGAFSIDWPAP